MEQLQRIRDMEAALDAAAAALAALDGALETYLALRPRLEALTAYYEGPLWIQDFRDDEAGKLPPGLKRGVLSEDAVYDLLADHAALLERLRALPEL